MVYLVLMFNSANIKRDFPIFRHNPGLIFVDNASTTHKPMSVIESISDYYESSNSNIHRAVYDLGIKSDEIYEETKVSLCQFYNKEAAIYTGGTTDGFNKLARSLESSLSGDVNIIVSEMEHHSNLIPWQELCRRINVELRVVRLLKSGDLDLGHFAELLDDNTRVVSLVHISNTLGTENKLEHIASLLEARKCVFLVDAAQSCALHRDEIKKINADAFVFGAHKMFGPSGIGVILAKKSFLADLGPFNFGGGMVTEVEKLKADYRDDLSRFEGGTPPLAQIAGLNAVLKYLDDLDLGQCISHVEGLANMLRSELHKLGVTCVGNPKSVSGIVSATFGEIHPHDVASFLNSKGIAVRAGHHCTQLIMKKYDIHSSVRFSFSIYNQGAEVDKIIEAIKEMKNYFA